MTEFINNKYTRWYYSIINNRIASPVEGFAERHHIIPKSLGGKDGPTVMLSVREHFVCHWLLTKMTEGKARQKMFLALDCFTKSIQKRSLHVNSRVVEQARKQSALYLSEIRKNNATRPAGTYNHSPETRAKISASHLGVVKRPKGFKHDETTIEKMRQNRKGKNIGCVPWNKGLEQTCPHCGKLVRGTLNRWHGDNCRSISDGSK